MVQVKALKKYPVFLVFPRLELFFSALVLGLLSYKKPFATIIKKATH
jgi:hypothetical protein